jgi:hypothetical protein
MSRLNRLRLAFWVIPFIVFPVIAFAPWWLSAPITLLCVLNWFGIIFIMSEEEKKRKLNDS